MIKRSLIAVLVVLALAGVYAVALRGDRLETQFLRAGGGVIQMLAQRPARTFVGFACGLALVWGGVAILSACESRKPKADPPEDQSDDSHSGRTSPPAAG